jgi:CelD/BcsL family acetyltransferase involved in cellulose biosynthesis
VERVDGASQADGGPAGDAPAAALERLEIDDPRWRAFVAGHPGATPCHDPAWAQLLSDCYSLERFVLAAPGPTGELYGGLPVIAVGGGLRRRGWVSLPFTDHCPALLAPGASGSALAAALDGARRSAGVGSLEVRGPLDPAAALPPIGFRHVVELSRDPAEVFARFHHSQVQRAIRRLERDRELTIREGASADDLVGVFYRLHLRTRRRLGVPIQPKRFFRLLWERMIEPGLGFLLLAYAGRTAVAGALFLRSRGTLLYKYSASDASAWRLRPNHLVIWSAIQRGCEEGIGQLDFGRTELAHASLSAFKRSWGATEEPLVYSRLVDDGLAGVEIAGHRLLHTVISRSPPLVCRLTGELLYRYAA